MRKVFLALLSALFITPGCVGNDQPSDMSNETTPIVKSATPSTTGSAPMPSPSNSITVNGLTLTVTEDGITVTDGINTTTIAAKGVRTTMTGEQVGSFVENDGVGGSVYGLCNNGNAVIGGSDKGNGGYFVSSSGNGAETRSYTGKGTNAFSTKGSALYGETVDGYGMETPNDAYIGGLLSMPGYNWGKEAIVDCPDTGRCQCPQGYTNTGAVNRGAQIICNQLFRDDKKPSPSS